jgi:hypothetical protein
LERAESSAIRLSIRKIWRFGNSQPGCLDLLIKKGFQRTQVHERSVESDLALLLLRDLLASGEAPHLRLVLMSATADAEAFAAYFQSSLPEVTCSTESRPCFPDPDSGPLTITVHMLRFEVKGRPLAQTTLQSQHCPSKPNSPNGCRLHAQEFLGYESLFMTDRLI